MGTYKKGGQVSLVRGKGQLRWPSIRTANVFRDPYPGWGEDRVCRDLPEEWFEVDREDRTPEDFLADLECGERACLECPLATECRDQARRCKARGLFGAVVTVESGNIWPVDVWVQMRTRGADKAPEDPEAPPELRACAVEACGKQFTVSQKKPRQKYCSSTCAAAGAKINARLRNARPGASPLALAS